MEEVTNEQILNALNDLNSNTIATNNSIKELQEYLISKDRKEQQEEATKAKQEEQEALKQAELDEQTAKEEESAMAEQSAKADQVTDTYTELLTDINNNVVLSNNIFAGQLLFTGIISGILLGKILFDRFIKL